MFMRILLVCAISLSVIPSHADDPAQANKLLVEAMQLIRDASTKQTPAQQLHLLEASHTKLIAIIEQHPSTDLAVKLATGQSIGVISLPELTDQMNSLRQQSKADQMAADRDACLRSLDVTDTKCAAWLPDIVKFHLEAQDPATALEAAMAAESGTLRDSALHEIARHLAQDGNAQQALKVAESIEHEITRISALLDVNADVLQFHIDSGNFQLAIAAAQAIGSSNTRHQILRLIAVAQAQAGQLQDAYATVRLIDDLAIGSLAAAQVDRISQQSVKETRTQNPADVAEDRARIRNAHGQLQAGDIQAALRTAEQIENPEFSAQILDQVAMRQLQAGDFDGALNAAQRIKITTTRDTVYARIAQTQLQAANLQEASSTAKLIQRPGARDQVYGELARLYIQAKDLDGALTYANLIEGHDARDIRLNTIAQAKLQAGDIMAALNIAKGMTPGGRDNVFHEVVKVQTQTGQLAEALVITELISNDNARHTRLYYIALAQVQAGDLEGASSTAEMLPDGSFRNEILKAVQQGTQ